ncbi:MAG: major capsid family protein, partial [Beijerinckiaceae bacterium]
INGKGDDVPLANVTMAKFEETVRMAGIGASWSLEEIGVASQLGVSLATDTLDAARMAYERLVDDVVHVGDTGIGVEGLLNATGITSTVAAAAWSAATPAQIVQQIVDDFTAIRTATLGMEIANVLLLPIAQHALIETRAYGVEGGLTIADYLRKALKALMGFDVTIDSDYRLVNRYVIYKKAPDALKLHMPMPLQFIPPQFENFEVKTLGMFRFSALNIRKPQTMRYRTGI